MSRADDDRLEVLREFAGKLNARAEQVAGVPVGSLRVEKAGDGSAVMAYCPFASEGAHPHKGSAESVQAGGQQVFVRFDKKAGLPVAYCRCCTAKDDPDRAEKLQTYNARLYELAGIDVDDNVISAFGRQPPKVERTHHFDTQDPEIKLRHVKYADGVWSQRIDIPFNHPARRIEGCDGADLKMTGELMEKLFSVERPSNAIMPYNHEEVAANPLAVTVICEGAKDCDTFNDLAMWAGVSDRYIATCMPSMTVTFLPTHMRLLIEGRDVIVIPDMDKAGARIRDVWAGLVWDYARSVRVIDLPGLSGDDGDNDLSDWAAKTAGADAALLTLLEDAEPLAEAPILPDMWRLMPVMKAAKEGEEAGINTTHPSNGEWALLYHLAWRGRIRLNRQTGLVVTIDAPDTEGVVAWPNLRMLGQHVLYWFNTREHVPFAKAAFPVEVLQKVAANFPVSTSEEYLSDLPEWDQRPRAAHLLSSYLHGDLLPEEAQAMSRAFCVEVIRAMKMEQRHGRFVPCFLTEHDPGDGLAQALLPWAHGSDSGHTSLDNSIMRDLTKEEVRVASVQAEAVLSYQTRRTSLPLLLAKNVRLPGADEIAAPFIYGWGTPPPALRDIPDYIRLVELKGDVDEQLLMVRMECDQILAEAVAMYDEWKLLPPPRSTSEVQAYFREQAHAGMLTALACYVFRRVDPDQRGQQKVDGSDMLTAKRRDHPRIHISKTHFLSAMSVALSDVVSHDRGQKVSKMLTDAAVLLMPELKDRRATKGLTVRLPADTTPTIGEAGRKVSGFQLTEKALQTLKPYADIFDGGDDRGEVGNGPHQPEVSGGPAKEGLSGEGEMDGGGGGGCLYTHEEENQKMLSRARTRITHPHKIDADPPANEEEEIVAAMIGEAGICGIDFESTPNAPALELDWENARRVARGEKAIPPTSAAGRKFKRRKQAEAKAKRRKPCVMTVAKPDGRAAFVYLPDKLSEARAAIRRMFTKWTPETRLVAHNALFDSEVLYNAGIYADVECTMLASKVIYAEPSKNADGDVLPPAPPELDIGLIASNGAVDVTRVQAIGFRRSHSLKACMAREFGVERDKSLREVDWSDREQACTLASKGYAMADAVDTVRLWLAYERGLQHLGLWDGYEVLARAIMPTAEVNSTGLELDPAGYESFDAKVRGDVAKLDAEIAKIAPDVKLGKATTNAVREHVVREVLSELGKLDGVSLADVEMEYFWKYDQLPDIVVLTAMLGAVARAEGSPLKLTDGGQISFDKFGRQKLLNLLSVWGIEAPICQFVRLYHEREKSQKLVNAFCNTLPDWTFEGRTFGTFNVGIAVTGRQTCDNANLQQVPRDPEYRVLFRAGKGKKYVIADYSQVELRVGAIEAEDEALFEVYVRGVDVHHATAAKCFFAGDESADTKPVRPLAKIVNFQCLYGAGAGAVAAAGMMTEEEGGKLLASFLAAYPGIARYREERGHARGDVTIRPGRRVMMGAEPAGPRGINYPVQGGAASVQHLALRLVWEAIRFGPLGNRAMVLGAIHDEIIVECDEEVAQEVHDVVKEQMTIALLAIYPECEPMGRDRLVDVAAVDSWAEKA